VVAEGAAGGVVGADVVVAGGIVAGLEAFAGVADADVVAVAADAVAVAADAVAVAAVVAAVAVAVAAVP